MFFVFFQKNARIKYFLGWHAWVTIEVPATIHWFGSNTGREKKMKMSFYVSL